MKKILVSFLLCFSLLQTYCQEKVKPELTKKIPVTTLGAGRTGAVDAFRYKDELCVLSTNINVKLSMLYIFFKIEPYNCGMILYRTNSAKKGKIKTEIISLPTDKYFYNFIGSWYKGHTLNIYYSCKNKNKGKNYIFCTRYDLDTRKSEHFKVFETRLKNSFNFRISDGEDYCLMAASDDASHDKALFDYLIADHDLKPIDGGYDVALDDKDPLRIQSFTMSSKGDLVVKGVTRHPRKSILKQRTYGQPIYIVKNQKAQVIQFESDSKYISEPDVFFNPKGELMACYLYGEKRRPEGVSLVEVDMSKAKEKRSTVYGLNGSDKEMNAKSDKEMNAKMVRASKVITSIQITADGSTMILAEDYNVYTRTVTTTTRGGGTSSKSTTYYSYGPGSLYTFNADFENTSICKLKYSVRYANQDPGYGLLFIAISSNTAYLFSDNAFYKYRLGNTTVTGKPALSMKTGFKALFGRYSSFLRQDNKAYIFDIRNRRSINVEEYTLTP